MENSDYLTPVLGFGAEEIIGYWSDLEECFITYTPEKVKRTLDKYMITSPLNPTIVQISKTKINGTYNTYLNVSDKQNVRSLISIKQ
jgi:hypothetical protein